MASGRLRMRRAVAMAVFLLCGDTRADDETVRSTICETNVRHGWAVNYPKQRKLFFTAGLLWVFYSDGRDAVYRTSADGIHWSSATRFRTGGSLGHRFACWHDGTFLHYAYCGAGDGEDVAYRRGTARPDGTIGWSGPEQTACAVPPGKSVMYPKVIVDSAGKPWVAFMLYDGGFGKAPYDAVVTKASRADGVWETAAGFPFLLADDNTTAYPDPVGVPLTEEKTFWVCNGNVLDDTYRGRAWNGVSRDPEEQVTQSRGSYGLYNLAGDGDNVHLVFGGGTVRYRKRGTRGEWGEETIVAESASGHTSITRTGPGSVIVSWLDYARDTVFYREMVNGRWHDAVPWIEESEQGLANPELGITGNALIESAGPFRLAVAYTTGTEPPFNLKFAGLRRQTPGTPVSSEPAPLPAPGAE